METTRNKNNELCMQCIYIALTNARSGDTFDIQIIMQDVFKTSFDKIDKFSKGLVIKSLAHINEIIPVLEANFKNWKWKRISLIAQAILLMSYAHYKYLEKCDKAVVINIAIRLAKKYLDINDYKFINSVLDKVL